MSPSPDPPFDAEPQGISLDELARAFSQAMKPEGDAGGPQSEAGVPPAAANQSDAGEPPSPPPGDATMPPVEEDSCPVCPLTILEAMLFVGNRDNRPLTPKRAAELMRGVAVDEIPPLAAELNRRYDSAGAAYRIAGCGDGYRLALREEFRPLRNRLFSRIREARLSQAAVDVLALVAYEQPITAEKVGRLRGKPSRHVLAHLVRRGLLRIERPETNRRTPHYRTTDRFLQLYNLESLNDLPKSEDDGPP
ncbi:MAG: SMC-Scp complex subunit ScpB [Pirellulales bacterium]|nr:SMC-Scp complex subunit ScpB [Pirellulales bacterium]